MTTDDVSDPLRPLSEITMPDIRHRTDGARLEAIHSALSGIVLHADVPLDVRQLFETAKNLSLYSWFVYRFHQPAELIALSAMEMALGVRFRSESPDLDVPGLGKLMRIAKERKWIENSRFSNRQYYAYRNAEHRKSMELISSGILKDGEARVIDKPTDEEVQRAFDELDEVGGIVSAAHRIRNDLAHGSTTLHPWSISTLRTVAEVVNQVFTNP